MIELDKLRDKVIKLEILLVMPILLILLILLLMPIMPIMLILIKIVKRTYPFVTPSNHRLIMNSTLKLRLLKEFGVEKLTSFQQKVLIIFSGYLPSLSRLF